MDIQFFVKNFSLSQEIKEQIEGKLQKLPLYCQKILNVQVDLKFRPNRPQDKRFRTEVNVQVPAKIVRSVAYGENFLIAIDQVERKLRKQLAGWRDYDKEKKRQTKKIVRRKKSI